MLIYFMHLYSSLYFFCGSFVSQIHTSRMTMADDVDLEEFVMAKDELSGADIKVIQKQFI